MSQVNKIEGIIEDIETSARVDYDEVKQALLSAILEAMPAREEISCGKFNCYNCSDATAYNSALDEMEQTIKELFNGVQG